MTSVNILEMYDPLDVLEREKASKERRLIDLARRGDLFTYRTELRATVETVLTKLGEFVLKDVNNLNAKMLVISFHYSSRVLGQWLRIVPSNAWVSAKNLSTIEVEALCQLYDREKRRGHLLSDPALAVDLRLSFGANGVGKSVMISDLERMEALKYLKSKGVTSDLGGETEPAGLHSTLKALVSRLAREEPLKTVWAKEPALATEEQRLQSFLSTFFFSLACNRPHEVWVWPALDLEADGHRGSDQAHDEPEKIGSLAAVLCSELAATIAPKLGSMRQWAQRLGRSLRHLELAALAGSRREPLFTPFEEDLLRRCCSIDCGDTPRTLESVNLLRVSLMNAFKDGAGEDKTWAGLLEKHEFAGASDRFWALVQQVQISLAARPTSGNGKVDAPNEPVVLFFYSEPGCGKENLAKLAHFSSLAVNKGAIKASLQQNDMGKARLASLVAETKEPKDQKESRKGRQKTVLAVRGKELALKEPVWNRHRLFNFFAVNLGALSSREEFYSHLFGSGEGAVPLGRILAAHQTCGTVFLDEFNTLENHGSANAFLRLAEKPYEMAIGGRTQPLRGVRSLLIFASNLSRKELIEDGFNEAVIYRLTKRYFVVPPLRERPVDIAVFVNKELWQYNNKKGKDRPVERVDLSAMRLVCELPWPDNYRGVKGLLDEILDLRHERGIKHQELTFEMVLEGLRRRETLRSEVVSGPNRMRPGGVSRGAL
jgi:hypothetical protein